MANGDIKTQSLQDLLNELQQLIDQLLGGISFPSFSTIKGELLRLKNAGTIISQVYTLASQIPGEPILTGVVVVEVGVDLVKFIQPGSGTAPIITIRLEDILGWEL
ncbi:hypothetical protein WD019_00675 [Fictibacillus sp. Mic-4]|uniref:hypothetical protein n=1 Tax=Fictibacillus sp. Mic-4 TaxID=3132826 RepID=UPI003CEF325C